MQIIEKYGQHTARLPLGFPAAGSGESWFVASAEIPGGDYGGDIVRVDGLDIAVGTPIQAQHLKYAPDGRPTTIGVIEEVRNGMLDYEGESIRAKYCRFAWAPTALAKEYRELFP